MIGVSTVSMMWSSSPRLDDRFTWHWYFFHSGWFIDTVYIYEWMNAVHILLHQTEVLPEPPQENEKIWWIAAIHNVTHTSNLKWCQELQRLFGMLHSSVCSQQCSCKLRPLWQSHSDAFLHHYVSTIYLVSSVFDCSFKSPILSIPVIQIPFSSSFPR